jgi:C-terminal processing protease CtpA/Prc
MASLHVNNNDILVQEITIKRDRVNLSPVYSTALKRERDEGRSDVGYIRLAQFSNNSAADMRAAILELEVGLPDKELTSFMQWFIKCPLPSPLVDHQAQGVGEYILDLRSNPGGLVSAGINVASLWLDGVKPVFSVHGRDGEPLVQTTEDPSLALTHKPLAVLVNEDSASASEILAGNGDRHLPALCLEFDRHVSINMRLQGL